MMPSISLFEIVFSRRKPDYFEGDTVDGEVIVELKEDTVIENLQIIFRGTAMVQWPQDTRSRWAHLPDESALDEEQYLNQMICLYTRENNPQKDFIVPAGRHNYPFAIQLPEKLPSSFRGDYGFLTYSAKAVLERPFQPQVDVSKEFSVSSIVDLNMINADIMRPVQEVYRESYGFCCLKTGNITCEWRLERRGFAPEEEIFINGEIRNNGRMRIKRSKASLIQHTRYQGASGNVVYQRRQVTKLDKNEIPPGTIGFWRERMTVPPNLPQTGLQGCSIINIWYTLKLKVISSMHKALETIIEIIIGTKQSATRSRSLSNLARLSTITDNSSLPESEADLNSVYFA